MYSNVPSENPPPYDAAMSEAGGSAAPTMSTDKRQDKAAKEQPQAPTPYQPDPAPSSPYQPTSPPPFMPPTPVYHYVNPRTGEHIASLLPPDHPEMVCLQEGRHIAETRYGILGVLAAILWFPLGVGLCLLDRKVRCRRCGMMIDEGLCG
ncbi:hypothetical protein GLOTRDRAFT_137448 [Gloeophyllum trabeum ATCC 11539]|uniref:Brain protein I3 n=1 Tax=Gloeophyllum trabeum (strain ATCC 11539 / FP-39264 / Madison 617) TaxID=670483 RepID=S7RUY0_GLOTA|nr:uncharacterized protein GLOTRDRAFT_137448 [Gloeophyllum trabeum ATCC 11539]EPQ57004.1 hypothetical protein GLOTRDRAFT_137448 [Gloeophyllum trabeum ATCC 11539]